MKKTKVYRPRRGMRFSNGRRGISPAAGFVQGSPITRTRSFEGDSNLAGQLPDLPVMVRPEPVGSAETDSVVPSGSVMRFVSGPQGSYKPFSPVISSSSFYIEGSISKGRGYERMKLNAILLARPANSVGRPPFPSPAVMDVTPTGSFESPSWTHASIGSNQAFVLPTLSSSNFPDRVLNTFTSGVEAVEQSAVPASVTTHFGKQSRLQTIVVKHTASFFDTIVPTIGGVPASGVHVPTAFVSLTGCYINTVTGTNGVRQSQVAAPATIFLNVPVTGRLVDVKVWIELVHVSSSQTMFPLGTLAIALRNPNLTWGIAHPIVNDPLIFNLINVARSFKETDGTIQDMYRDTFLLWEGGNLLTFPSETGPEVGFVNNGSTPGYNGGTDTGRYPSWQKDRHMRTVFSDGAPVPNPRMLYSVNPSGNFVGSPNSYTGTGSSDAISANSAYGCNVTWTSDSTVTGTQFTGSGSPPKGWLNGIGGKADVNEWPTTGFNYGTPFIRPLYPLLDSIFAVKSVGTEGVVALSSNPIDFSKLRGFRPGLRGTEISGTWQLLLSNCVSTFAATASMDTYFRQARLEITYERPSWSDPRTRSGRGFPAMRSVDNLLYSVSGSTKNAQTDTWVNRIFSYALPQTEFCRSFGIALRTGSFQANSALVYRLTGSLANIVGEAPSWLLSGPGGVPVLPESSATLAPRTLHDAARPSFDQFFQPRRGLDRPQLLSHVAADANPHVTLRDLASAFVSASTI